MGKMLKIIGTIVLIIGIIVGSVFGAALENFYRDEIMFLITFLPFFIVALVFFLVLFALGNIYDVTRDTNALLHKKFDPNANDQN